MLSKLKASPNAPNAAQLIDDRVVDMIIFLALRHFKWFHEKAEFHSTRKHRKGSKVMKATVDLVNLMVYEMHSYETPLSPYVKQILSYLVRLFIGEASGTVLSDKVLENWTTGHEKPTPPTLAQYLEERTFMRNSQELTEDFKADRADLLWA